MVWFKVDDQFAIHEKVAQAGNRAIGLWVRAGAWSCMRLTDGFIPAHVLGMLGASDVDADELVEAGLWLSADEGYRFHDWAEYQPTAESVNGQREREREKKRRQRRDAGGKYAATLEDSPVSPERVPRGQTRDTLGSPTVPEPEPEPHVSTDVDTSISVISDEFERAWGFWPKKVDKKTALAKFKLAARKHPPEWLAEQIITFGNAYAATTERQYTPGLAVWLNKERWTDDLPTGPRQQSAARVDQNLAEYARLYGRSEDDRAGSVPALDAGVST